MQYDPTFRMLMIFEHTAIGRWTAASSAAPASGRRPCRRGRLRPGCSADGRDDPQGCQGPDRDGPVGAPAPGFWGAARGRAQACAAAGLVTPTWRRRVEAAPRAASRISRAPTRAGTAGQRVPADCAASKRGPARAPGQAARAKASRWTRAMSRTAAGQQWDGAGQYPSAPHPPSHLVLCTLQQPRNLKLMAAACTAKSRQARGDSEVGASSRPR